LSFQTRPNSHRVVSIDACLKADKAAACPKSKPRGKAPPVLI
jgi:hypothetical protein